MNKKTIVRRVITSESYIQQRMDSVEKGNHNKEKGKRDNITLNLQSL